MKHLKNPLITKSIYNSYNSQFYHYDSYCCFWVLHEVNSLTVYFQMLVLGSGQLNGDAIYPAGGALFL